LQGPRTETGLHNNISVGITYLEAWLGGNGCIPVHNLMEDAATAEIARTQVCLLHSTVLDGGGCVSTAARSPSLLPSLHCARRFSTRRPTVVGQRTSGQQTGKACRRLRHTSRRPVASLLRIHIVAKKITERMAAQTLLPRGIHAAALLCSLGTTRTHAYLLPSLLLLSDLLDDRALLSSRQRLRGRARCGSGSSTARRCSRATSR